MNQPPQPGRVIVRGEPYPLSIPHGVVFDAFAPCGSLLRVGMPAMTAREVKHYRTGPVRFGIATDANAMRTLWKFGPQPWIDAPFDARVALDAEYFDMPPIHYGTHLVVNAHIVDTRSGRCEALRAFTLGPSQTAALAGQCLRQIKEGVDPGGVRRLGERTSAELAAGGEIVDDG